MKVVKNESVLPCGCIVQEYADGTKAQSPCLACGLSTVGAMLGEAGRMLQAMGARARKEATSAAMSSVQSAIASAAAAAAAGRR